MKIAVARQIEPDHQGSEEHPSLGLAAADETRHARRVHSEDATQGRQTGSNPYEDASQGRQIGSDPYDDATRARDYFGH